MTRKTKDDFLDWILSAILLIIGIFIGIQIIRFILGGSWSIEDVILGLLIFNLGLTGFILRSTTGNRHDIKNLEKSFNALAGDFKKHRDDRLLHSFKYKS